MVARLIMSAIEENIASASDYYPKVEDMTLNSTLDFIPKSARILLTKIFQGKQIQQKVSSVGQAIIQVARPRVALAFHICRLV